MFDMVSPNANMGVSRNRLQIGLTLLILPLVANIFVTLAQDPPPPSLTPVNVLFFYEEEQFVKHFDAAVEYIKNTLTLGVDINVLKKVHSNGSEAVKLVTELCLTVDELRKGPHQPELVIDFTRNGIPSEAVKMVVKTSNIPTVSATFGQEGDIRSWRDIQTGKKATKYLVQISPPADLIVQSMRSIVGKQDMTSAVLLFDETQYEMYHKYKALLQNMPTRHLLTKVERENSALRKQIDRLVHVDIVNFFIASTPNEISEVLSQASDPEMRDGPYFSDEYAWFSMSLEEGYPKCTGCKNNVTVIHCTPDFDKMDKKRMDMFQAKGTLKNDKLTDLFYFDLAINGILAIKWLKDNKKWTEPSKTPCSNKEKFDDDYELDLYEGLKNTHAGNFLKQFHLTKNGDNYAEFELKIERLSFKERQAEPENKERIGTWRTGFGEQELITPVAGKELSWKAHQALTVFRIVTVVQPPFVYKIPGCIESKENKYSRCFEGYCIDLLNKIQDDLKFNYTIRNVSEYGYMSDEAPHEWSGMVRELKDRKADIALGAMSVMAERESVVDFTVPYYDLVGISILMRKPKTTTSLFKFLTVLENDVWMCILGAYFFTSILMWIFDRWSPYSYQNNREKYEDDEEKREFNLKECLWFCMTSLTPQGGGEAPKNLSGRLVAATWWLFGFIIIASYTANLAAFLTVSRLDAPIESLEDLSKQYRIQYAPVKKSAAWIYFDRMAHIEHRFYEIWKDMSLNDSMTDFERSQLAVWDYPVSDKYTKMWQAMQENNPPAAFDIAVERVRGNEKEKQDGFAFLGEATDIKYEALINCEFQQVGEEFSRKPYAIAVQKGSPLKESFSHMLNEYDPALGYISARTCNLLSNDFRSNITVQSKYYFFDPIGDATDIRYEVLTSCDVQMVGEEFSRKPYALAVQQGSPLKDQLNDAILKLLNQRHLEQLKERWWNENKRKANCPKDDNQSDGISIHNIGGVFIVIFVGIIMACFTLVFEYWWYRKRNITEEMAEMALPAPKDFAQNFTPGDKTNFSTQYNKPPGGRTELPSIENSW